MKKKIHAGPATSDLVVLLCRFVQLLIGAMYFEITCKSKNRIKIFNQEDHIRK